MAFIETRYSVGDRVYLASTNTERKQHPCPDCKGTREWKAISPAGCEYSFSCPRCSASYHSNRELSLDYSSFEPFVRALTIGSVQYNSARGSYDHGARYMCAETGVGSGSVYDEDKLFPTEEEALTVAKLKASEQNSTVEWVVKLYDKTLELSDYQLENALIAQAKAAKSEAGALLWNLSDLFSQIEEAADKDAILEAVDDYKRFSWERDKQKVAPDPAPAAQELLA